MTNTMSCSVTLLVLALAACDRPVGPTPSSAASTPPAGNSATAATVATPAIATASASPAPPAQAPAASGTAQVNFDSNPVGAPSPSFEAIVGDWYVAELSGARGLKVDGGRWTSGTPSANLADQAKRLYGDRYAEFLDGVKAFAFFPLAIWNDAPPSGDVRVSVRFYPQAGKIDQAAGIAFGIAPDGSYYGVRANALENNLLYFKVVKGRRTVIDNIRNVPTSSGAWHTLVIELVGNQLIASVDGANKFEKKLEERPGGKLGLWSKADSQVLFDDFAVSPR